MNEEKTTTKISDLTSFQQALDRKDVFIPTDGPELPTPRDRILSAALQQVHKSALMRGFVDTQLNEAFRNSKTRAEFRDALEKILAEDTPFAAAWREEIEKLEAKQ